MTGSYGITSQHRSLIAQSLSVLHTINHSLSCMISTFVKQLLQTIISLLLALLRTLARYVDSEGLDTRE
jgi:hypothetical protein